MYLPFLLNKFLPPLFLLDTCDLSIASASCGVRVRDMLSIPPVMDKRRGQVLADGKPLKGDPRWNDGSFDANSGT